MSPRSINATNASDVDRYLAAVPEEARGALSKLRETIRMAVPEATELISYQMPAFKYKGRMLVAYAAFADHCSLFGMSAIVEAHKNELESYDISKGTIRFTADNPLPESLARKLVRARAAENEARASKPKSSSRVSRKGVAAYK